ncbi:TerC family protein [Tumebacillus permanentifrigoris]|uniref:YjbE family integral membrane protein n=1 Tax=Tumebacillus permanentifrigoris TaxID=378543 RepID=A0A316D5Q1_9BACL|nr:TerC family protein [Tumebacillus permanentifrigoris]PWK09000.1 YjbE family integral membrane protein [Tumebacillus permanentifrigoris]
MEPTVYALILLKIILINLVLSGDNAVVIALACRNLPAKHRQTAFLWGSVGAVVCMVALTFVALQLLQVPLLQASGGLLLIWIALKLLQGEEEGGKIRQHENLWRAVWTIIVADAVMSLDNTVAVAAIAKGNLLLIGIGLAVSIPLIIWGANALANLMGRFPLIVWAGAMLLGYTAGEMMVEDERLGVVFREVFAGSAWLFPWLVAGFVLLIGRQRARKEIRVVRKLGKV